VRAGTSGRAAPTSSQAGTLAAVGSVEVAGSAEVVGSTAAAGSAEVVDSAEAVDFAVEAEDVGVADVADRRTKLAIRNQLATNSGDALVGGGHYTGCRPGVL